MRAHRAVRPLTRVVIWNRTRSRAIATAFALAAAGIETEVADELEAAVREADVISCATLAAEPLIRGEWLQKGVYVDLVGGTSLFRLVRCGGAHRLHERLAGGRIWTRMFERHPDLLRFGLPADRTGLERLAEALVSPHG